jgi:hypothetical protein
MFPSLIQTSNIPPLHYMKVKVCKLVHVTNHIATVLLMWNKFDTLVVLRYMISCYSGTEVGAKETNAVVLMCLCDVHGGQQIPTQGILAVISVFVSSLKS